ncbi:MAG TPA: hypothetical protein VFE58_10225 [Tepidisphaeraceae bacterium]|jgi:hypothetical protein|nr:hypothetical protein [Tepidisphaeraceae bacterium]
MKFTPSFFIIGSILSGSVFATPIHTQIDPAWTRPTSAAIADSTLSTYAQWNGFAATSVTNLPTGDSYFGSSLTSLPTAGDSTSGGATPDGAFVISNGTANNSYYSNVSTGDIYSFSAPIAPRINMPTYNIAGNQLNVLVQVESDGSAIDSSQLTVNGIPVTSLPNYSVTQTYTITESTGFGDAVRNDYAWSFTLPSDPASLQLDFGWADPSTALVSAIVDTQSVVALPEPASCTLLALPLLTLLRRHRRMD